MITTGNGKLPLKKNALREYEFILFYFMNEGIQE
jgi:hypothetical protein